MKTTPSSPAAAVKRPPAPNSAALKLFVVLSRAFDAVSKHAARNVEANGMTNTEWAILEVLYHKGPLLLGDVQRRILVSSGGITYLVDRLEARGLLERLPCAQDRRARYASLTPAGEQLVHDLFPAHLEQIEEAMAGLTVAEQKECTRLLRSLGLNAATLEVAGKDP